MTDQFESSSRHWLRWGKALFQATILALVAWGIWRAVGDAWEDLSGAGLGLFQLQLRWVVLAMACYAIGFLPSCLFWKKTLEAMGQRPNWPEILTAYWLGHLGKYVPGKALVVVIRTSLIRSPRVDATVAATSIFVETLTMMAVGAALAATILAFRSDQPGLLLLALGLALCAGLPTWPPLFRQLVRWFQVRRANPQIEQAVAGLDARLMAFGWLAMTTGWLFIGLSLWATLNALPKTQSPLSDLPLLVATISLASVAGFLSLVPAGLVVRELVIIELLESAGYDKVTAIVSAAVLRLVCLILELGLSAVLYARVHWQRRAMASPAQEVEATNPGVEEP